MEPIKIVLAEVPQMLCDIVTEIVEEQPDMTVIGEAGNVAELGEFTGERPDFLILGLNGGDLPDVYRDLLAAYPRLRVLAVSGDGRHAFLHELVPHVAPIGELSPTVLLDTIRTRSRLRIEAPEEERT